MKNIYKLALLIFSFWSFFSWADRPGSYFMFYCRGGGGITLNNQGFGSTVPRSNIIGEFKKNFYSFQSGTKPGSALFSGSCSWFDRPLNDGEPMKFFFQIDKNDISNLAGLIMLNQCVSSNKCWFAVCGNSRPDIIFLLFNDLKITWDDVEPK